MNANWPETTEVSPPAAGEVHVWAMPLDDVRSPWPEVEHRLSDEDHKRSRRFLRDETRRSFTIARAGMRSILGRYLNTSPEAVPIECELNGKPRVAPALNTGLHFNLAHSGELALLAVTRGGAIGIDVERLRTVEHWPEIASRYFTIHETAIIGADAVNTPLSFFRCWTRKEAVLKAIGVGIIFPLDMFSVPLDESIAEWIDVPAHSSTPAKRYWLQSLGPGGDYVGAVAATHEIRSVQGFTYRI